MKEYHKINNVFKRDPLTNFKTVINGRWAEPEFEYLAQNKWTWTEKIDGTNIRVIFENGKIIFKGKTDAAQLYAPLIERLQILFYEGALSKIFDSPVCLYGEGFGAKIQKGGGNYIADGVDFCLFDVLIGTTWLERDAVVDIANKLQCQCAPSVGEGSLVDAIDFASQGFYSHWGDFIAEGVVVRPSVELKTRKGNRIIAKIKHEDFVLLGAGRG